MKVISQETFDLVVLENVKDFDNTLDEAIEGAVREFESQDVQLSNIVKNLKLSDDKERVLHEVLESLNGLKKGLSGSNKDEILSKLMSVTEQCKLSLAHRVLATKHDGYNILLRIVKEAMDSPDILAPALDSLSALSDTNPDILNEEGVDVMLDLLNACQSNLQDERVVESLAKWCLECCLKHEKNRQHLFQADVPKHLVALLKNNRTHKKCTKAICRSLRAFTLDDDIRAEFGKAHDHARMLVEECRLIETCLELVTGFLQDSDVTSEILSTLSRLCVRAEYCQEAVDKGALTVINDILVSFPESAVLNRQSMNLLKTISGNDKVKEEVIKIGAGHLIVSALLKHQNSPGVCEAGCAAVSMLALRVGSHAKHLIEMGAGEAVVQAMKMHPNNKQIQKLGCMAIRNLVSRVPENRAVLQECQVEDVIHTALKSFESDPSLRDVAKAALRDLDLKVTFEEQWRGTGVEIGR